MVEKVITSKEFEGYLQNFVGKNLTELYYTTDSLVTFKSGKKFPRENNSEQIYDSEYELSICGGWNYLKNSEIIETSIPKIDENIANLRDRIGKFIDNIHINSISDISISDDGKTAELILDNGDKFEVFFNNDSFIEYSERIFGDNGNLISATHARPKEDTGELIIIKAP